MVMVVQPKFSLSLYSGVQGCGWSCKGFPACPLFFVFDNVADSDLERVLNSYKLCNNYWPVDPIVQQALGLGCRWSNTSSPISSSEATAPIAAKEESEDKLDKESDISANFNAPNKSYHYIAS